MKHGGVKICGDKQTASSGLCRPSSPSAMISSTVTWCRPTVKPRPTKFAPAWLDPELLPPPPPPEPGPELTNSRRESKNFLMMSKRRRSVNFRWTACSLCTDLLHWQWWRTDRKPKRPVHQPSGAYNHALMSVPVMMMPRQPRFFGKFPFACRGKPVGERGCG